MLSARAGYRTPARPEDILWCGVGFGNYRFTL